MSYPDISAIRDKPNNPDETLFSRRTHDEIDVKGDAIVFPLELEAVQPASFVSEIKKAQEEIYCCIERDLGIERIIWADKEIRHREKLYKKQKKLHLAFAACSPPAVPADYDAIMKRIPVEPVITHLKSLLSSNPKGKLKEIKWNEDGHIVVRITISSANGFFQQVQSLRELIGQQAVRYTDPEKQTTLAAVICVAHNEKLSFTGKEQINLMLKQLQSTLHSLGDIQLNCIEWIEYERKRTLSENSRVRTRCITRTGLSVTTLV